MNLPITVIIRTLNEEDNILECVQACLRNRPLEVVVVDGGSTDRTTEILQDLKKVKVLHSDKGLATQRDAGIRAAAKQAKYIAIVDADDHLADDCLLNLYNDLENDKAAAAQARHEDYSTVSGQTMTFWEAAMLVNMKVIRDLDLDRSGNIEMIGRPALYRKDLLNEVIHQDPGDFPVAAEDSDLAYKLRQNGARFVVGTGKTYRKHVKTFRELYQRWLIYGAGDARFLQKHPERTLQVLRHLLYVYPIKRAFFCAMNYSVKYTPFFILQGIIRFTGMLNFIFVGGIKNGVLAWRK